MRLGRGASTEFLAGAAVRPAGDEGHDLLPRPTSSCRGSPQSYKQDRATASSSRAACSILERRRPDQPRPLPRRQRRAVLHGAGLRAVLPDDPQRRRSSTGSAYLKPEAVKQMTSVQTRRHRRPASPPGNGWGLGWCVVREPQGVTAMLSPGTFGHGGAYGTQAWIDPRSGVDLPPDGPAGRTSRTPTRPKFERRSRRRRRARWVSDAGSGSLSPVLRGEGRG